MLAWVEITPIFRRAGDRHPENAARVVLEACESWERIAQQLLTTGFDTPFPIPELVESVRIGQVTQPLVVPLLPNRK